MNRYATIPAKAWLDDGDKAITAPAWNVHEADKTPVKTGLLDTRGNPIVRLTDAQPIGFDLRGKS